MANQERSKNQLRIRAGTALDAALTASGGWEQPTLRVNSIVGRFLAMVEAARPGLSKGEWCALCDANNGYGLIEEMHAFEEGGGSLYWKTLWMNVEDTPGIGEKWGIDAAALIARLKSMSEVEQIAVAETVQRFWTLSHLPTDEALDLATSHPEEWPEGVARGPGAGERVSEGTEA